MGVCLSWCAYRSQEITLKLFSALSFQLGCRDFYPLSSVTGPQGDILLSWPLACWCQIRLNSLVMWVWLYVWCSQRWSQLFVYFPKCISTIKKNTTILLKLIYLSPWVNRKNMWRCSSVVEHWWACLKQALDLISQPRGRVALKTFQLWKTSLTSICFFS